MQTKLITLEDISVIDAQYGDFKLQVFPFNHKIGCSLPVGFKLWKNQIDHILSLIPLQESALTHYLTIDSKFFTTTEYQRREGIHIDGNFCVDPKFQWKTWGGTGWSGISIENGKIVQAFESPYNIQIPFGQYVSESLGGIICASSQEGCEAWIGEIDNAVQDEGAYPEQNLTHIQPKLLKANTLYFMSSNTPHRTLLIPKGARRTLIRITLNHNYKNNVFVTGENQCNTLKTYSA